MIPKPLSQKSIDKLLAGWKPETVKTLHAVYASLANLYGVIMLREAWQVVKPLSLKITKTEFMNFSSIVRREALPYSIYEINEIYSGETPSDANRHIVNKMLLFEGYGKFSRIYRVDEMSCDKPLYCPTDLLQYETRDGIDCNPAFVKLCNAIRRVKATNGQRLSEYAALTETDQFDLDFYKAESKKRAILLDAERPAAERIIERLKCNIQIGGNAIDALLRNFEEYGIKLTAKQLEDMSELVQDSVNYSRLWVNRGWTPYELLQAAGPVDLSSISLGPGMKQAIRDGSLDIKELEEGLAKMGIKLIKD